MGDVKKAWREEMRAWIDRSGLSRQVLAEKLGCTEASVRRYTNGSRLIPLSRLLILARTAAVEDERIREAVDMLAQMGSTEAVAVRKGLHSDCWGDLLEVTP